MAETVVSVWKPIKMFFAVITLVVLDKFLFLSEPDFLLKVLNDEPELM